MAVSLFAKMKKKEQKTFIEFRSLVANNIDTEISVEVNSIDRIDSIFGRSLSQKNQFHKITRTFC